MSGITYDYMQEYINLIPESTGKYLELEKFAEAYGSYSSKETAKF